jgi:hypothetical protein
MSLSVLILYFFLNTYNTVAIATSWSVAPIETTSELIPLNIALSSSKTDDIDLNIDMASILEKVNVPVPLSIDIVFFFKYLQHSLYCDILECCSHSNHVGDDTS